MYSVSRKRLIGVFVLTMILFGVAGLFLFASPAHVNGAASRIKQEDTSANTLLSATGELTHHVYLPMVTRDYGPRSSRLGYCAVDGDITRYPDIRQLAAGWYVNFHVESDPVRPLGLEYVQTVRLHQLTECWPNRIRDRDACPYVKPYTYTLTAPKSWSALETAVKANPGSLWLVGNEMDRYDWGGDNPYTEKKESAPSGGQDEMLPELYAQAYHEIYHKITTADPTAKVAIGGIIQATPARLWYLDEVWGTYRNKYGRNMPVDVWNVHNFIFKEKCDDFGADIPPGCPESVCTPNDGGVPCYGKRYADTKHNSLEIFDKQIRAFRGWMAGHGQQAKPLIVSEYGIVYHHAGMEDGKGEVVKNFMRDTFDYFMTEKDCSLSHQDDCRLVQRWAWYSLDDDRATMNKYSYLFDQDTRQMQALGQTFADYAQNYLDVIGSEKPPYWP
jgi:hypothetical protein